MFGLFVRRIRSCGRKKGSIGVRYIIRCAGWYCRGYARMLLKVELGPANAKGGVKSGLRLPMLGLSDIIK
jgi:hypothetical protein